MLRRVYCAVCIGIEVHTITVETEVSEGINFFLVGLADSAVRESQQRIASALGKFGYRIPGRRIIINMAPADMRKEGSAFDVPIAMGILSASGQIGPEELPQERLDQFMIMGELALDGTLRPMRGALPIAIHARRCGFKACIFPKDSALEALEVDGIDIFSAANLADVVSILLHPDDSCSLLASELPATRLHSAPHSCNAEFADIKGQLRAKRAMEIAAAGSHNLLFIGSPGCGKSLLAKAFPSILPEMTKEEMLETGRIYSILGLLEQGKGLPKERPFRAPHHTATTVALTGGGVRGLPGEVSLAHNGVLFADELPEFSRAAIEALRQPLEEGSVNIARLSMRYTYPASFIFLAAMNPCPCGYFGDPSKVCSCSPGQVRRYRSRISGPLMDRIDLQCELTAPKFSEFTAKRHREESSAEIRKRVTEARKVQEERFAEYEEIHCNAQMTERMVQQFAEPDRESVERLGAIMEHLHLSMRTYSRILKVARTIADLEGCSQITFPHIAEAIGYRNLEWEEP